MNPLEETIQNSNAKMPLSSTDYVQNGFYYCGVCNLPKTMQMPNCPVFKPVRVMCKCEQEAYDAEKTAQEERDRLERLKRRYEKSGLTDEQQGKEFKNLTEIFENRSAISYCSRYADNFKSALSENQGLMFLGPTGTGKTELACCIANQIIQSGKSVYFTTTANILSKFKSFSGFNNDQEDYLYKIERVSLLIVDDIGADRQSDYSQEIIYNVINRRYEAGKPLIVTTNLTDKELQGAQSINLQRIFDRLAPLVKIPLVCESWRVKQGNENKEKLKQILEG